jgi:hypothetical protein
MEFHFNMFRDLFNAITVIEKQPVVGEGVFYGIPGTPLFLPDDPAEGFLGRKIKLRKVIGRPDNEEFRKAVIEHMYFTTSDGRENLQKVLDIAVGEKDVMVLSVTVCLKGTYCTHMHNFLFCNLSWKHEI